MDFKDGSKILDGKHVITNYHIHRPPQNKTQIHRERNNRLLYLSSKIQLHWSNIYALAHNLSSLISQLDLAYAVILSENIHNHERNAKPATHCIKMVTNNKIHNSKLFHLQDFSLSKIPHDVRRFLYC